MFRHVWRSFVANCYALWYKKQMFCGTCIYTQKGNKFCQPKRMIVHEDDMIVQQQFIFAYG